MEDELNPYKQIDNVLEFIIEQRTPPYTSFSEIDKKFGTSIKSKESIEILFELENSKYIFKEIRANIAFYYSTFSGRMFYLSGGYQGVKLRQEHAIAIELQDKKTQENREKQMDVLTKINLANQELNTTLNIEVVKIQKQMKIIQIWIATGTGIAALYYVIQILKHFYWLGCFLY